MGEGDLLKCLLWDLGCPILDIQIFNPKTRKGSKQTHLLLLQHVKEWHSVVCAITSNKENVTVAAEISVGHTKQVLETERLQIGSSNPRGPIL